MRNGIYVVATPIGNIADVSDRAKTVLSEVSVIACEDTRVTKKLLSLLNISLKKEFISLHNFNENEQADKLIELAQKGLAVAQVSDAGTPLISDPGYKLAQKCRDAGVYLTVVPGPCALICALQLSGLPTDKFMFAGFVPNKEKARLDLFKTLKNVPGTLIFYETAPRLLKTLDAAAKVFGNRQVAVAREITKLYEECRRGTAAALAEHFAATEPKGEIVFMVAPPEETATDIDFIPELRRLLAEVSLKSAVKAVVEKYDLNKNDVYETALRIKNEQQV